MRFLHLEQSLPPKPPSHWQTSGATQVPWWHFCLKDDRYYDDVADTKSIEKDLLRPGFFCNRIAIIHSNLHIGTQVLPFVLLVNPLQHSETVRILGIIYKTKSSIISVAMVLMSPLSWILSSFESCTLNILVELPNTKHMSEAGKAAEFELLQARCT